MLEEDRNTTLLNGGDQFERVEEPGTDDGAAAVEPDGLPCAVGEGQAAALTFLEGHGPFRVRHPRWPFPAGPSSGCGTSWLCSGWRGATRCRAWRSVRRCHARLLA